VAWALLVALAVLVGLPRAAGAQVVQGCQPDQYVDRTATNADREIFWDFTIFGDPERCMQVRVGQTVTWGPDLESHPLAGQGGDMPNPINLHENGSVTFVAPGTFGYFCTSHTSMKGAIRVVPAPVLAAPVPALSSQMLACLAALLFASGLMLTWKRQITMAAMRSHDQ
jgi:hypothetical protein